jgi:hypothetical protein
MVFTENTIQVEHPVPLGRDVEQAAHLVVDVRMRVPHPCQVDLADRDVHGEHPVVPAGQQTGEPARAAAQIGRPPAPVRDGVL